MNDRRFSLALVPNKLFFRILLYFLSLLLPIIVIGSIFYIQFTEKLKQDFTEKISLNVQASVRTIDVYLQTTQEITMSFFYDDAISSLLKPYGLYTEEERARLIKVSVALGRISGVITEFIDQLFVFVDDQKVYTTGGLDGFDVFFNRTYSFADYKSDFWKSKLDSTLPLEILQPSLVETIYLQKRTSIPLVATRIVRGYNAVMGIAISSEAINKILKSNSIFPSSRFIVLDGNGRVLLDNSNMWSDPELQRHLAALSKMDSVARSTELEVGGEASIVTYAKSETYGWNFYSVTPVQQFKLHSGDIVKLIVLLCLVLFAIGIIFSFIFAVNIYSPIKKIREILTQQDEAADMDANYSSSSKNEYERINMSIHQLLKYNSSFKDRLDVVSMEYMDHALIHILHGNPQQQEKELQHIFTNRLGFDKSRYLCCNIQFSFKPAFYQEIQDTERIIILHKLKKIISGLLKDYVKSYVLEYQQQLYVCIVNVEDIADKIQLKKALQLLVQTFNYDSQYCRIRIGIGSICDDFNQIVKSYGDAMTAIGHSSEQGDFWIVDCEDLAIRNHLYYSFVDENVIVNCLHTGEADKLSVKVEEIIRNNQDKGVSHPYMNALLLEMYKTGLRFLASRQWNDKVFISEADESILSGSSDLSVDYLTRSQLLIAFYRQIIDKTVIHDESKVGSSVINMIEYIEKHYDQDLYLEKIAEELGGSSKYLSRLFKEKTGVNLTDYISTFRISKASKLLVETDLNVGDIAVRVGIFSRSTFLRLFKKYMGVSPNDYRSMNRK